MTKKIKAFMGDHKNIVLAGIHIGSCLAALYIGYRIGYNYAADGFIELANNIDDLKPGFAKDFFEGATIIHNKK